MDLVVGVSSDAAKSLISKLGSLLAAEYTLIRGVHGDIQFINDELESMHAFLILLKRATSLNEQRLGWMKQVREVAYDIEDCIDSVNHRLVGEPRNGRLLYLRKKWYLLTTLYARSCIATEISNLKVRAQHVSERRERYGVENPGCEDGGSVDASNTLMDRPILDPVLICIKKPVGIDVAMADLKNWFDDQIQDLEKRRYLAIVGDGGLGKTTLAMALHQKFGDQYHFRASVLVSQKINLSALLRSLIKQFNEQQIHASRNPLSEIEEWKYEVLKNKLKEQVEGKRYLILVDDIWSVSALEKIKDALPSTGGSIVVTTRFSSVAAASCSHKDDLLYKHQKLNDYCSYKLFSETICSQSFESRRLGCASDGMCAVARTVCSHKDYLLYKHQKLNDDCSYKLFSETICSQSFESRRLGCESDGMCAVARTVLINYCRGLPLAIILVAGLMGTKLKSNQDSKLVDHLDKLEKALSVKLCSKATTDVVTQVLEHCYEDLQVDLKTCFLYLSVFPKGLSISRRRLMRRWIAEGFIVEKNGKTVNEVAEDCFNELISRNFIWAFNYSSNGKVKNYQIHDMVLQYIVSKSSDENFITVVGGHWQISFPSCKVRRLSVHRSTWENQDLLDCMKLSHVRSLTALESFKPLHSCLLKFRILKVLDLEHCKELLPHHLKKICKMYQLKYLSLRGTDIREIPSEIGNLEYLEVLDIRETEVKILPASADRLKRMLHLLCGNKSKGLALTLTEQITKMTALETVSGIEICGSYTANMIRSSRTQAGGGHWPSKRMFGQKVASRGSSKEVLEALQKLTNLKKLHIYIHGKFEQKNMMLLLSAIEHLTSCSLKFLAIDDDFTDFLDKSLSSSKAPPEHLHTLQLSGMLSNVPNWIIQLHSLKKLTLSLTSLRTDTLKVLAELHQLFSLTFSLDSTKSNHPRALLILHNNILGSRGEIFVPAGGFTKLQLLRFLAPVLPPLNFQKGAMPDLQRLELKFRTANGVHGLENLGSLQQVFLGVSRMELQAAEQIKQLASWMVNGPTVIMDEYNESSLNQ